MRLKTTPNKQITLPDETASQMGVAVGYSDVEIDRAAIILTPDFLTPDLIQTADAVRDKLIALGIVEKDIIDACAWARRPKEE